jgi:hypothetical protein
MLNALLCNYQVDYKPLFNSSVTSSPLAWWNISSAYQSMVRVSQFHRHGIQIVLPAYLA